MLLDGSISSKKTDLLIENFIELVNSGVDSSEILVILQNSSKKKNFVDNVLEKVTVNALSKLNVYSFFGLVYNTISDNWVKIENTIPFGKPSILPNLVGMEVSQFILRDIISEIKFEGYNSKKSLLHQLFRRYSLIVQNNLSDNDVRWRSEKVLKEGFSEDAKLALDMFKRETLKVRGFDYLRQGLIFNYIYKNTDYFSKIKYLFLDDGDEITPICLDFIKWLKPQIKKVFVGYDKMGGSRLGYLSADKSVGREFEKIFGEESTKLVSNSIMQKDSEIIFDNVLSGSASKLQNILLNSVSKRPQMIDCAVKRIKDLIERGVKPSQIAVVTPVVDDMLKFCLKENLSSYWLKLKFLSGSEKLAQKRFVLATLAILKLADENLCLELSEIDVRAIISGVLEIPIKYCDKILLNFKKYKKIKPFEFKNSEYTEKYEKFVKLLGKLQSSEMKLSEQVYMIYDEIMDFSGACDDDINKFNFFIKELEDFEKVFSDEVVKSRKSDIINQIENSIISENPYSELEIADEELIVATPQKIIDNQIKSKYQIWLDVSSDEWIKNDTGPLYNAWVFQAGWEKSEYTFEDNLSLSNQKNARILRKLVLCAGKNIFCYASLFDGSGVENFGGIEKFLKTEAISTEVTSQKPFIPREDQKPVLCYKKGTMAISAVPGAGKTTILLELIIKLLNSGFSPENIFVLTYMESAARNFRERIQNACTETSQLPNISTIHGLALKILKENNNFEKLGLSSEFEICDDTMRSRIIREISVKMGVKSKEQEDFDRAVSVFKLGGGKVLQELKPTSSGAMTEAEKKKLSKFFLFFKEYDKKLKADNLIDYEDMLRLSVKLLEENPDIRAFYQDLCKVIVEDEAQDSSAVQQKLIGLLSAKNKNLIRCGDVNQAITTTFSNADVEGFKIFIENAETSVKMNCSQRCTKDVWTFANNLIPFSKVSEHTKNSFYEIYMKPVEGRNPVSKNAVKSVILDNEFSEKNYILKQIKKALADDENATFGILLRNNYQVARWIKFVDDAGLKCITRSECLEQKGVFRSIFATLKMILNPFDNSVIADSYDTLSHLGHYKCGFYEAIKNSEISFIQMNADNIANPDLTEFYWDLTYWVELSSLPIEELVIKIGLFYYSNEIEKSNVYLISTLIKRMSISYKSLDVLLERLGELAKKPSLSGFKFFSDEDESASDFLNGKIQIMTLHKSKGDEFDYVFLPEMTEKNLTLDFDSLKLKPNAGFMENVRRLNPNYRPKTENELKESLLEENFRLLYVAITRAKKKLFITTSKTSKPYGKVVTSEPSVVFELLGGEK